MYEFFKLMFNYELSAMLLISRTMYYSCSTSVTVIIFKANFQKKKRLIQIHIVKAQFNRSVRYNRKIKPTIHRQSCTEFKMILYRNGSDHCFNLCC